MGMIPLSLTIIYGSGEQWGRDEIYPDIVEDLKYV